MALNRTFVIADIHGHVVLLKQLLDQLPIDWECDDVVVLGDCIDRGPASHQVIDHVMHLAAHAPHVVILRGNHEAMLLAALADEHAFAAWLAMGGTATYQSYCPPTRRMRRDVLVRSLPTAVCHFLTQLPYWYENIHGRYVHASATRTATGQWAITDHHAALWGRDPDFFRNYDGPLIVVGHTPTPKLRAMLGEPIDPAPPTAWESSHVIALDCDVSSGGPLCAVELPARRYYYAFPVVT